MSRTFTPARPEPSFDRIYVGADPAASEWYQYGRLANFVMGKGAVLVPSCGVQTVIPAGSTFTFRFYTRPRATATQRRWTVGCRADSGGRATVALACPGLPSVTFPVSVFTISQMPQYTETLSSANGAPGEISISVTATGADVIVDFIHCEEYDRASLAAATLEPTGVTGPDLTTLLVRQPIRTDIGFGEIGPIANLGADTRRVGIAYLSTDTTTPWTRTDSATYEDLTAHPLIVQGHRDRASSSTCTVYFSVYAKVTAGSGEVRFQTSEAGDDQTATITSTSFAWSTPQALEIMCDDFSDDSGLPGGAWDELTISLLGPGGADVLSVAAVSVWFDDYAWEPSALSGLRGRYRMDSATVSTLTDLSGNSNNATQGTAGNQGTIVTTGFNTTRRPYLDTITDDYYRVAAFDWDGGVGEFTIIAIVDRDAVLDGYILDYTADAGVNRIRLLTGSTFVRGTLTGNTDTSTSPNTAGMFWFRWDGATRSVGTGATQQASAADAHAAFADGGPLTLLAQYDNTVTFDGNTAEILIYNRALSDLELRRVAAYAAARYDL